MQDFRKLEVWGKAHTLAKQTYFVGGKMLGRQNAALQDQLLRAALSIPTNIAEGRAHKSDREFARFLRIAFASAMEVEYLIFFANEVEILNVADFRVVNALVIDVKKMLTGLIQRVDESEKPKRRAKTT